MRFAGDYQNPRRLNVPVELLALLYPSLRSRWNVSIVVPVFRTSGTSQSERRSAGMQMTDAQSSTAHVGGDTTGT